jgi:hypothetical protein
MKTELQKYEGQTGQMLWISLGILAAGAFIYFMWHGVGAVLAAIGVVGLIWCFLRR